MQDAWPYRIPGEYASGFGHRLVRLGVKAPRQSRTWRHDLLRSSAEALTRRDCSSSPQEHGSSLASASAHGTLLFRLRPRAIRPSSQWQSQRHSLGHSARRRTLFFQKIPPISYHNWTPPVENAKPSPNLHVHFRQYHSHPPILSTRPAAPLSGGGRDGRGDGGMLNIV